MKVKDIMVKDVASIAPTCNVMEALKELLKMRRSGLPVVDNNSKFVNIIRNSPSFGLYRGGSGFS